MSKIQRSWRTTLEMSAGAKSPGRSGEGGKGHRCPKRSLALQLFASIDILTLRRWFQDQGEAEVGVFGL